MELGGGLAPLSDASMSVWAKSTEHDYGSLPLWRHLADSAGIAARLWDEWLPAATRRVISRSLPDGESDGRRLARWLAGVHDIGKATPAFAVQVRRLADRMRNAGLSMPDEIPYQDRKLALHATAGQLLLEDWLQEVHGWEDAQARQFAVVVGGHHGVPPTWEGLNAAADRPRLLGLSSHDSPTWRRVQHELMAWAAEEYGVTERLPAWRGLRLSQAAQVLLSALVIVADWIASNEEAFPYDPEAINAPARLARAWEFLDLPQPWRAVPLPDGPMTDLFQSRFGFGADAVVRPVQARAVAMAREMPASGVLLIEAPMGEGKTEAALAAAEVLAARSGAGGCFIALPTRATSDAMFQRVQNWLTRVPDADPDRGALSVMLAHGKAVFNEDYRSLMRGRSTAVNQDAHDDDRLRRPLSTNELAVHRWLSGRKKAMLSSFVVGTIDQLLFAALRSRHLVLRHLGLAGKVVIIDEAHAYDVYMSRYLDRALEWLAAYGVPTIVLSATLPARRRKAMIQAYDRGRAAGSMPAGRRRSRRAAAAPAPDRYAALDGDIGYPVLVASGADGESPTVAVAEPSGRETTVGIEQIDDDLPVLAGLLRRELADGGCALVVCNTVRRVLETADALRAELPGIEVSVAHSRFLAPDRAVKDRWLRDTFGPPEQCARAMVTRPVSHVVVASQVAEQSLDIDFDLLVTDLAPVDLLLQRMGRLHRHPRGKDQQDRPPRLRDARCVIRGVDWNAVPPEPVSGSVRVYHRHALLRSLAALDEHLSRRRVIRLPADIAPLVQAAYGDRPLGPEQWQGAMETEAEHHRQREARKEKKADTFRLDPVAPDGEPLIGWLDANVGDADDDPRSRAQGRAQVRDTAAESVEVLVLVRRPDGVLVTPPWLSPGGGREVSTEHTPPSDLARIIASCTLSLPYELCTDEVIEELERRHDYPAWHESPWLAEELFLVLDSDGTTTVADRHLHYSASDGLRVGERAGSTALAK